MMSDRAQHVGELPAVAERDADDIQHVHGDQRQREIERRTGDHADHGDGAAELRRADRLLDRAGAADLDHEIDAAAVGELARGLSPFRVFAIIDHVIGAERTQPRELFFAR